MLQFPIFILMELNKRRCCTCKEIKEVSDFHKNKPDCKICRSMYAKAVRVKGGGTNRIDRSQEVIGVSKTCTICKQVLALMVQLLKSLCWRYTIPYIVITVIKLHLKINVLVTIGFHLIKAGYMVYPILLWLAIFAILLKEICWKKNLLIT